MIRASSLAKRDEFIHHNSVPALGVRHSSRNELNQLYGIGLHLHEQLYQERIEMVFVRFCGLLILIAAASSPSAKSFGAEYVFHQENVIGTTLELRIEAQSKKIAQRIEEAALAEIDRLNAILSRYDASSELMRWQRGETATSVSADLATVLTRAEYWRQKTSGAFDVRVGALSECWQQAENKRQVPSTRTLQPITTVLRNAPWKQQSSRTFQRVDSLPITLDGLAKGYILDAVCDLVTKQFPDLDSFTVNIGGDLRTIGSKPLSIAITDPADPSENAEPMTRITISRPIGLATSGGYRRFFEIDGKRYSKLIDPRSGQPVQHVLSASAIAPTAMDADALATAICVLGRVEGLRLVESLAGVECLVIDNDNIKVSSGWPKANLRYVNVDEGPQDKKKAKPGLVVDFTLNRPKGGRYRRPYVAIWLEDADGFPVKTALLWMQTEQPGPRWHRDLTRWYRNDRLRKVVEDKDLIDSISGATRGPGEYQARFDGTDNTGKPLPYGKYTLYIEAAREHGTYQIIRQPIELDSKPIGKQGLKENVEVTKASFQYAPWPEN